MKEAGLTTNCFKNVIPPQMNITTLFKFNLRYYRRHSLLSLLCLLGIALGVGIVVAVELINDSALASFARSVDVLSGKATYSLVSRYGHIDENLFASVWKNHLIRSAAPVIEVMAVTLETGDEPIRFVGIDPFLDAEFRKLTPGHWNMAQIAKFVAGEMPSVYLSQNLMLKHGLRVGDTITVLTAGIEKKVAILGKIPARAEKGLDENIAVMDISSAQEVFGRQGYLDRIDIISQANVHDLVQSLPKTLRLTDANFAKVHPEGHALFFPIEPGRYEPIGSLRRGFSHLQFLDVFRFISAGGHVLIVDSRLGP